MFDTNKIKTFGKTNTKAVVSNMRVYTPLVYTAQKVGEWIIVDTTEHPVQIP